MKENLILCCTIISLYGCSGLPKKNVHNEKNDTTYRVTINIKGDTVGMIPIVNGKANGKAYSYYDNGNIQNISFYADDKLEGEEIIYTEKGEIAEKNTWKNSRMTDNIVYWQAIPYTDRKKFYHLSDTGVYRIKNGRYMYNLESHPPEGFIIEKYDDRGPNYYVYKNGKFELYPNPRIHNK